jgi:hypothetical protein
VPRTAVTPTGRRRAGRSAGVRAAALIAAFVGLLILGGDTAAQPGPTQLPRPPVVGDDPRWPVVHGLGICVTEYGWCPLAHPEQVPAGAACYCVAAGGVVLMGTAVPRYYSGHVNPYFNPWKGPPGW